VGTQELGFFDPPPSDRELSGDVVRHVLHEQFPELAAQSLEYLGSGWEHEAYLVDHHLVIRFPRYAGVARGFEREERLLTLVASATGPSISVPRITHWGKPSTRFPHNFAGHEMIPGVAADDPSVPETPELADDLGHALTRIHAIPEVAAQTIGVPHLAVRCRDPLEELHRQIGSVPDIKDLAPGPWFWLNAGPRVPANYDGAPRFIHNDFSPDHIIVNRTTGRLSGIIDWSGAALGDPAQDFAYLLLCRGLPFLRRAVEAYRLPTDAAFTERAVFLARVRAVGWLADAIKRHGRTTPALASVQRAFASA
jgi:aminoglycoside phosphotransferase (APT) family kinase protein